MERQINSQQQRVLKVKVLAPRDLLQLPEDGWGCTRPPIEILLIYLCEFFLTISEILGLLSDYQLINVLITIWTTLLYKYMLQIAKMCLTLSPNNYIN